MDKERQYPPIVSRFWIEEFYDLVVDDYPVEVRRKVCNIKWRAKRATIDGASCVCPIQALNYFDGRLDLNELRQHPADGSIGLAEVAARGRTGSLHIQQRIDAFMGFVDAWDHMGILARDLPVVLQVPTDG